MNKKTKYTICIFLVISLLGTPMFFQTAKAQIPPQTTPTVAIQTSEYTQTNWTNPAWKYFSLNLMLKEAFKSDGTPYVEISDQQIETGNLLVSGVPKYPILFSLACECISDKEAQQLSSYVSAGGFVYAGASSWTRYENGSLRTDFALSPQMGLKCASSPSNNWGQVETAKRIVDNRLVNCVPLNVNIDWRLPLNDHTLSQLNTSLPDPHYAWKTTVTSTNPAQVLMTIDGYVMLAIKQYNAGWFIYNSELAPLASYSIYSPMVYEYIFISQAVSWAFQTRNTPLVKLSPWPYQYNSAFIIRHDMDNSFSAVSWMAASAQAEKNLGVVGQYYIVTGDVRDTSNKAALVSLIQQAANLGAQVGSHNGGLNCTPWNSQLHYGDYEFYHWSVDAALANYPTGLNGGVAYANKSIALSFGDLQSWLGVKPDIWVSPCGQACWDESLQIINNSGITTSGEFTSAPFPQFAYSITSENVTYNFLQVPFSRWISSSGKILQSMEEMGQYAPNDIQALVDFYYSRGLLVSPYCHSSSVTGMPNSYITYCLLKPNMWNATPQLLSDWTQIRQQVSIDPQFNLTSTGFYNLTLTVTGASSPNTAIDVTLPVDLNSVNGLQVLLNGVQTSNYRVVNGTLKIQSGQSTTVTVLYSTGTGGNTGAWTQTSQSDFQAGTLSNLDASTTAGQLTLTANQTTKSTLFFSDDFSNSTYTSSRWTARSGNWNVYNGLYNMTGSADTVSLTYGGNSSWTNYVVEVRECYVSGEYAGGIGARLNPSTGARYTFLTCPNAEFDGPNVAMLVKFSSWKDTSGTLLGRATVTTDTNWHTLKIEVNGTHIKCYYDTNLVFNLVDSSYSSGLINLESFGNSKACFDYVNVTSLPTGSVSYSSTGTLVSSAFDSGSNDTCWNTFSFTSSVPTATNLLFRTKTAQTQADLSSANWSSYITINNALISNGANRWIQYEATLSTNNTAVSPILYDVTLTYSLSGYSASWIQNNQTEFQAGTLNSLDATTVPGQLTLAVQQNQNSPTVLFSDDFSNSSWTSSHWTVRSGTWTVSNGYYNMAGSSGTVLVTYAGNSSWTNYVAEARTRFVSGEYTGDLSARVNPSTGSRYSFIICPAEDGPNKAMLVKFSSWQDQTGTLLGQTTLTTDTNWHTVKMELNGTQIKCYYDGSLKFSISDGSFSSGLINFESFGSSNASFDWVNVTAPAGNTSTYYPASGTLISSAFDSGSVLTNWTLISWSAATPNGTSLQFRIRVAATQADLAYAAWSDYFNATNSNINSFQNRWIQYEATLTTSNNKDTPTLYDVTIQYTIN
jgi:hypothetical protein